jgi:NAD(P)-dependent dehydrogenase (short-subunit alcohol dehydrogenase family)
VATLNGHISWVTGASSGIGRACALELARRGATVVASARRTDKLDTLIAELRQKGARSIAVPCDVTDEEQVRDAVARIAQEVGTLSVVLANAGCSVAGTIEELTGDDWRRQLDVNVVGAALTARHALPQLLETKGRLGLTGSVAGFMIAPGYGAYHASKYALRALGQTLSVELEGTGVTCTTIHPGFVESEIMKVDNRGRLDPSRSDERPASLVWSADKAAAVMVDALVKRRRELVFTGHGKVGAWFGKHLPSVMHTVMSAGPMAEMADRFREK